MKQIAFIEQSAICHLRNILEENNVSKVFLVRGRRSYKLSGAEEDIEEIVSLSGIQLIHFYDFEENPKLEDVLKGLELLKTANADIILAVGGGSVLDMAKLIRFYYAFTGDPVGGVYKKERNNIPLVAIPTTAGTGCETTHFAVLYKDKVKYSIAHDAILPDYAIVDPRYTYNNSSYLTACTGFDALAQAIEAYWNVYATSESDEYAIRAIRLLWPNLPLAVNEPTISIRNKMSEGAYWAGRAINITKTTAPHAFSYPFTTYYGILHGHAVSLTFLAFFEVNTFFECGLSDKLSPILYLEKMKKLFVILGIPYVKNLSIQILNKYIQSLGLTTERTFDDKLILENVNYDRLSNNPVIITGEIAKHVLNLSK